jgi:hypothetical protein
LKRVIDCGMPKKATRPRRTASKKARTQRKPDSLIQAYAATLRSLDERRISRPTGEIDSLPRLKLARPAVRPTDVSASELKKAVREAAQAYIERHSKALAK